jgi:hypothetical protein
MGRGTSVRALFLSACLVMAGGSIGCQALYGGKPEKLAKLERKTKPKEAEEKPPEIKYVEECSTNFRDDPKLARRDPSRANALVGDGDDTLAQASRAKDEGGRAELVRQSIDKYRSALVKDPYNAEATLKLALAYERVYRKGCVLALLKRIASLESNPTFKPQAKRVADSVADDGNMFKGYRKDAVQAVGR